MSSENTQHENIQQDSIPSNLTPLLQQYVDLKNQNPDAILLFRCGDFYETFFDDAVLVAKELQIALTARGKTTDNPVPLAGVPHHSVDNYIAKLVKKGFTVAICEQMEDPKIAKGLIKRDIVRIITPGTLSDPDMLEKNTNNYLSALSLTSDSFCLASVEISTGEFIVCDGDISDRHLLPDELTRLSPREVLFCDSEQDSINLFKHLDAEIHSVSINRADALEALGTLYPDEHKASFMSLHDLRLKTLGMLAEHLLDTQRCLLSHLRLPLLYKLGDGMVLDEATLINLELLPGKYAIHEKGSLFDVVNRTKTSMGGRLLKKWLMKPLIDAASIIKRHDKVEHFYSDSLLLSQTTELLKNTPDLERVLTKLILNSKSPRDLQSLQEALLKIQPLKDLLFAANLTELEQKLCVPIELIECLQKNLADDLPAIRSEGGFIRDGVDKELDEMRSLLRDGDSWLKSYEEQEREKTGIRTLKVKKNSVFGYFIEISKSTTSKAPEHYVRKQTLTTGERYITAELKDYENKVFSASDRMIAIELQIFDQLIEEVVKNASIIQQNATAMAEVDVISSLAKLAHEKSYIRPEISEESLIEISQGRHPVVESFIESGGFHPNDLLLNDDRKQAIITGPNMAGKSTYLRQTALIVLLAQMGSFVPADRAKIGIVDRIFTRVGASDNLVRGQSTFMVEMMETSNIIRSATSRSLLILDEIGRGTSTFDGLSLAWAILEHITKQIGARSLFATHYHEMTELEEIHKNVFNLSISVNHDENSGKMIFLHKIEEGPANKSYGIEVAQLAGIPTEILIRAKEVLFELEKTEKDEIGRIKQYVVPKQKPQQLSFFSPRDELTDAVLAIDINNTTPLQALTLLNKLRDIANDK